MAASRLLGVALDTLSRGLLANNQLRARMAPRNLHGRNPVNHRVFERKLRPRPLSQGHACLGVTHRCPSLPFPFGVGELVQMLASRSVLVRLAQMMAPDNKVPRRLVVQS
uniref:Uncharacterized protein n=1 Tax=Nelumbo nucifera TaxID=4432 RepID=A0A822ZQJ3_NELNU|nr:TPA_asm: hypothetical protein HUJ06_017080 [Nelumbo nucifera]